MLFSKLGAMFRQVSEQQAGRQAVHLFLAVATAGQRGLSWVTERERRAGVCVVFHRFGELQQFCVSQGHYYNFAKPLFHANWFCHVNITSQQQLWEMQHR